MRNTILALVVVALASPLAAETWKSAQLMDAGCAAKKSVMEHPETHTRSCAMQCSKAGYGVLMNGKFVKFDKKGDEMAAAALKKSEKKDHLTVDVTGEMKDGKINVTALSMN